jgi:nucleotide-binding universal stress UspA family protein
MKILATFDGSPLSEAILPQLSMLAALPNVEMDLLSVAVVTPSTRPQSISSRTSELETYLNGIVSRLPQGPDYRVWTDVSMYPATTIIEWAKNRQPDLIVLATHGRSGIVRLLLGSVASQVLHAWIAPTLLIHPPTDAS